MLKTKEIFWSNPIPMIPIFYLLKTPENLWFSCVFRGYEIKALARNALIITEINIKVVLLNLTLLWRRSLSYRNKSIDLLCKSVAWFLYAGTFVMKELMSFQRCRRQSRLKEMYYGISRVLKKKRFAIVRKIVFKIIWFEHNCLWCNILLKCGHSCSYSFSAHRNFLFSFF